MARRVSWTNNSSGHDGTTIHRSTATMDPQTLPAPIGTVAAGIAEYIDSEALADGTYYYRVQDYQGASVSAASAEQSFTISTGPDYSTAQVGDEIGGGVYAGVYNDGVSDYHLISALAAGGGFGVQAKTTGTATPGTTSDVDGPGNTDAMIAAGKADHPVAANCVDYINDGFDDWHMPALNEMVLVQSALSGHPEFADDVSNSRWMFTSSEHATFSGQCDVVRITTGAVDRFGKEVTFAAYRAVRRVPV